MRMQGHMAVAISMAMAAGLALTGCGSTGTTGVSAETSAGGKNEAGRNTAGNTAGGPASFIKGVLDNPDRKKVRVGLALRR